MSCATQKLGRMGAVVAEAPEDPLDEARSPHRPGQIIASRYRLTRLIGEGGMGSVWLARHLALDADVAVKLVPPGDGFLRASEHLLHEARATARLQHPSIVRVFDSGVDEGGPFLAMEVVQGESLGDLLARKRRIRPIRAVQVLLPIASALCAAHAHGVVHRDVKPDNILLSIRSRGAITPKIVDFGIAMLRLDDAPFDLASQGGVVGSPFYMSPEQAQGCDIDERTDVWSLAVVLYEAITGRGPFERGELALAAIVSAEPVPTSDLDAGDDELWRIIARGLAKRRDDRWPTMRAFGEALAGWAVARGLATDLAGTSIALHWLTPDGAPLFSEAPPKWPSIAPRALRARALPDPASKTTRCGGAPDH